MNRLSTKKIDNLKPRNIAYRVNDGDGLYLNIGASGVKSWVFRYKSYLKGCLLYTSPSPRDGIGSRMPSSA